jgi:hypothetical protein
VVTQAAWVTPVVHDGLRRAGRLRDRCLVQEAKAPLSRATRLAYETLETPRGTGGGHEKRWTTPPHPAASFSRKKRRKVWDPPAKTERRSEEDRDAECQLEEARQVLAAEVPSPSAWLRRRAGSHPIPDAPEGAFRADGGTYFFDRDGSVG